MRNGAPSFELQTSTVSVTSEDFFGFFLELNIKA